MQNEKRDPFALLRRASAWKISPSSPQLRHGSLPANSRTPSSQGSTTKMLTLPASGSHVTAENEPIELEVLDGKKLKSGAGTGKTESRTGRRGKRVVSFSESDSEADESSSSSRGKVSGGVTLRSIVESSESEELNEIRVEIHSGDQVNCVNKQTDESESEARDDEGDDEDDGDDDDDRDRHVDAILEALGDLPTPPRAPPHEKRWSHRETGYQALSKEDDADETKRELDRVTSKRSTYPHYKTRSRFGQFPKVPRRCSREQSLLTKETS